MVKGSKGVGLAAAELGDEGHDRCGVLRPPRQTPKDHPHVLPQSACEAGARKELLGLAIVVGTFVRDHLLQSDGELVGIESATLAHFGTGTVFLYQGSMVASL